MTLSILARRLRSRLDENSLLRELFSFCVVGGIGFIADFSLFMAFEKFTDDIIARCLALTGATILVWWLNRQFTFLSTDPDWGRELGRFALSRIFGTAVNAVISLEVLWNLPSAGKLGAVAIGTIVALTINYLTSKFWAYRI
jgi:putative flippase GtrA